MKTERNQTNQNTPLLWLFTLTGLSAFAMLGLTGCTTIRPSEQRLVAKPNMTFTDSAALSFNSSRLMSQFATGLGGAASQNSGCTSCR
jgi:hypothetical protein